MQLPKSIIYLSALMLCLVGCSGDEETAESDSSSEGGGAGSLFSLLPQQSTPAGETATPGAQGQTGLPMTAAAPTEPESTLPEPAEITVPFPDDIPVYQGAVQIRGEATEDADMFAVFVVENVPDYQTVGRFYQYDNLERQGWHIGYSSSGFAFGDMAEIHAEKPGHELEILIKSESDGRVSITMKLNEL